MRIAHYIKNLLPSIPLRNAQTQQNMMGNVSAANIRGLMHRMNKGKNKTRTAIKRYVVRSDILHNWWDHTSYVNTYRVGSVKGWIFRRNQSFELKPEIRLRESVMTPARLLQCITRYRLKAHTNSRTTDTETYTHKHTNTHTLAQPIHIQPLTHARTHTHRQTSIDIQPHARKHIHSQHSRHSPADADNKHGAQNT